MPHEAVDVEDGFGVEQVVGDAAEFVGEDGQALGGTVLRLDAGQALLQAFVFLGTEDGGFGEGPLEPGVAGPGIPHSHDFASGFLLRVDQPGVGAELLAAVEAFDRVDFEQDGHGDDGADDYYRWLGAPIGVTDLVFITDAIARIPQPVRERFLLWKAEVRARLIALVVDNEAGDLAAISDETHTVRSLSVDEEAIGRVLSV
jgi:hypothetical protein